MPPLEIAFNTYRSLLELAPAAWEGAEDDPDLAAVAQRLAPKPVRRLTPAELHALLVRNLCLAHTAPLALERLSDDPFLEAAQYPGDLLTALLESDYRFWSEQPELWAAAIEVLETAVGLITRRMEQEERGDYLPWHLGDDFMAALVHFRGLHRNEGD